MRFIAIILITVLSLSGAQAQQLAEHPHGPLPAGLDCASCHSAQAWSPLKEHPDFDHNRTDFPLLGAHTRTQCASCHLELRFDEPKLQVDDCASCHVDVHQGNLSDNCASCHNSESFSDVDGLAVHAQTSFPLTGAHEQLVCEACHTNDLGGAFTFLDTACIACHEADYDGAQTIDHRALGFPTDCEQCHSTLAWAHAVAFDHATASNGFDLVGAHARIRCESCHEPETLTPIFATADENDCVACHQSDYDREHQGSGFPTTCLTCHNTDSWEGALFRDHDQAFFPIFSGKHKGEWDSCQTCHIEPQSFQVFTCLNCHEHRQSKMDDKHREVRGYVYDSLQCYACHPDGREEDD